MSIITSPRTIRARDLVGGGKTLLVSPRFDDFGPIDAALKAIGRPSVTRCGEASAAILEAKSGEFDLIIIDLECDALSLLTVIKAVYGDPWLQDIVCVALTSDPRNDSAQRALEIGIDDLLQEPLEPSLIQLRLRGCLERRKLRNEILQSWIATANDDEADHARMVLNALPEPVLVLRPDSVVEVANSAAERLFGMSEMDLLGTPASTLLSRAIDNTLTNPICAKSLAQQRGPSICVARTANGLSRPVHVTTSSYERFEQKLIICVLREVDWANAPAIASRASEHGLKATAELWSEVSGQIMARLDQIAAHIGMMREEVFGPVGTAIYKSYLSEAQTSLDQARHLLDHGVNPAKDRRIERKPTINLQHVLDDVMGRLKSDAELRRVSLSAETGAEGIVLRAPKGRLRELLLFMMDFALCSTDHGGTVVARVQCGSDRRLLLTVQTSGCDIPVSKLTQLCKDPTNAETARQPLTVAWAGARAAAKALGGRIEIDAADGRGIMLVAMLPQRRQGDHLFEERSASAS